MRTHIFYYLIAGSASLALSLLLYFLQPVDFAAGDYHFQLESGTGFAATAEQLRDSGLIRSPFLFKAYAFFSGAARKFKAGNYIFSQAMSAPEIIGLLASGPPTDLPVLISEGMTIGEIDEKLHSSGIIKKNSLIKFNWQNLKDDFPFLEKGRSLEGFLFPDTYRFYPASPVEEIVFRFLSNFQKKALPLFSEKRLTASDKLYRNLIIASLIEKEVPFRNDRLIVSGIIQNRLKISMPLQIDAAPYTYQYYGLPPTPIANPGLDAIYAALHPASTSYLYYLSDPKTKKTIFAETLDEHNENRAIYLKR